MPKPTYYANLLKRYLKKLGVAVLSEVDDGYKHIDLSIPAAKLDVEVDGVHHLTDSQQILKDLKRSSYSYRDGYDTIHVHNMDLKHDAGGIASAIAEASAIREERFRTEHIHKKFLLLDFDGVVADSFLQSYKVYKTIHPHTCIEDYRRLFEGNVNHYDHSQDKHTDACRPEADWTKEYTPVMEHEVKPFPGMKHILQMLSKSYTIIIISSTATLPIKVFLVKYGLTDHIHEVLGNDVHTSKVVKTHMVFQNYHVEGKDCLFITDTLGDLKEASRSGVRAVGVTWGYNKVEMLHRGPYYRLVNTPKEILVAVNDYFNQKTR